MSPSSRARSRRTGSALRRRHDSARVAEAAGLLEMRQPRDRYGGYWDRARGLASASPSFPTILRSGIADRLPCMFQTASGPSQASALIWFFPITGTGAGFKPRRRARVLALELPRHFSGSVLFRGQRTRASERERTHDDQQPVPSMKTAQKSRSSIIDSDGPLFGTDSGRSAGGEPLFMPHFRPSRRWFRTAH